VLALLVLAAPAVADPTKAEGEGDIVLEPAVVRALRIDVDPAAASSSVERLDAVDLAARGSRTLGDALDGLAGLRVRRYGPLGSLQSVSLRGSSSGHTTVIADGVRLDSMQGSMTDVSLWRVDDLQSVEVAKGGHSAQYGTGAGAGVILLEGVPVAASPAAKLTIQAGAFGYRGADVGLALPTALGGVRLSVGRREATNDYGYEWLGKERRRDNADVEQDTARLRWDMPVDQGEWTLTAMMSRRATGAPGADTGAPPRAVEDRARQWDDEQLIGLRGRIYAGSWRIEPTLNGRRSEQRYVDPLISVDSLHRPNTAYGGVVGSRELSAAHVAVGIDGERQAITSTDVVDTDRTRAGAFVMALRKFDLPDGALVDSAQVDVSARGDSHSDFGSIGSPRAGLVLRRSSARLFANVGRSFRAPTFNDLYWSPGGNPDLDPERGVHRAFGAGWGDGRLAVEASRYHTRFTNEIRWVPGAGGVWSPMNVSRSRKSGWDSSVSARHGAWRAALRGSRTAAVDVSGAPDTNENYGKQLRLTPENMASGEVMYADNGWGARAQHRWIGSSFTRADGKAELAAYGVLDISAWRQIRVAGMVYDARIDVTNGLDSAYVIIPGYPMPGRSVAFTLGASL
jgi:vitamin B12 transporter